MLVTNDHDALWDLFCEPKQKAALFHGDSFDLVHALPNNKLDLTVTSPPYCMGKEYDRKNDIESFVEAHAAILPEVVRATKNGGSICWQIGNYVRNNAVIPLDYLIFDLMRRHPEMTLRNRIVWTFGHGLHCQQRFSGRYETVLWFTKGDEYHFDLDAVRVAQKYPGKKSTRGPNRGEFSGNPLGKNPTDVWDIPNVKANHVEKTEHPCQFPVALVQRLVKALTKPRAVVFDPYCGSGSSGVATLIEGRRFIGAELEKKYLKIAQRRIDDAASGQAEVRPLDLPVYIPGNESVARRPAHFTQASQRLVP